MAGLDKSSINEVTRTRKKLKSNTHGIVFDIQGYSIDDGTGIRKLVFLKGCHVLGVVIRNLRSSFRKSSSSPRSASNVDCALKSAQRMRSTAILSLATDLKSIDPSATIAESALNIAPPGLCGK